MSGHAETTPVHETPAERVTAGSNKWFDLALGAGAVALSFYLANYARNSLPFAVASANPVQWGLTIGAGLGAAALALYGAGRGSSAEQALNVGSTAAAIVTPTYLPAFAPISTAMHRITSIFGLRHTLR